MSMYLFDEHPIIANKTLAREIGLNEALILQQINYWIEINKKTGNNFYEGRYWTYNSIRKWQENDFDYMSFDTVKRTFAKLEKQGYLLSGNFNKDPRDKTKWYTLNDEKLIELYQKIEQKKKEEELKILQENVDNFTEFNTMPNALGQNAPMEKGKIHQCNSSNCTNAFMQNAPMQYGNLPQPLPKITTKNTTEITSDISTNPSIIPLWTQTQEKNIEYEDNNIEIWKEGGMENKKSYHDYLEILRKNTCYYDHLEVGNHYRAEEIDEILTVLADVMVYDDNDYIKINQINMKASVVRERFLELRYDHLEHLVTILKNHDTEVRNIRAFILTAAYNILTTIQSYYTNKVGFDCNH
ncbi:MULTISPECIES: DUF6017 domain-containing protein [unclassified Gemella]|uniref:DUF6017 domain-containing protein n=1 Tax=unclassified Gemella TaxID=2624949 RepID=UPI001C054243|nr:MULTISPECIES: DUF6017 domain-containing protein [unclassified Gemella]MBU0279165.1 conjugal transfer protein [Gemella sp. zg-1178]QWQ38634.1 conjugal transfer protein [Gemella sp. zg-570]